MKGCGYSLWFGSCTITTKKITITFDFEHFSFSKWNKDMKICDCSCKFFVDYIYRIK